MSPPLINMEDAGQNDTSVASSSTVECDSHSCLGLKERYYLGLNDCSSADSSRVSFVSKDNKNNLNLKAIKLRLGLPGSQSPERDLDVLFPPGKLDEKPLFPLLPSSHTNIVLGNKRGYSEVNNSISKEGNRIIPLSKNDASGPSNPVINIKQSIGTASSQSNMGNETRPKGLNEHSLVMNQKNAGNTAPAAKAQAVGWPPIRSFRKNSLASSLRNNDEVDGKPGLGSLFIKVSMDGAPYLRKVDLENYSTYQDLSSALEKMFICFIAGQCGSNTTLSKETQRDGSSKDLLHGPEYVLTYEDKDGDWMLVGDVPWEMFMNTCKKIKIMKGCDAIGLAPRASEKSITCN